MNPKFSLLFIILTCVYFNICFAQDSSIITKEVEIDAQCDVYYHSMKFPVADIPGGAGIEPITINVTGMRKMTIARTEGKVTCEYRGDSTIYCGADGGTGWRGTTIISSKGFSGVLHETKAMFLVGVFVSNAVIPEETPESLNFTEFENHSKWGPNLEQVFFIGDGRNKKGEIQEMLIPEYADRLLLGFADALTGYPSHYNDNKGTIKATILLHKKSAP